MVMEVRDIVDVETAIDIIYSLPSKLDALLDKISGLEARNAMLEAKLNAFITSGGATQQAASNPSVGYVVAQSDLAGDEESEIMDVPAPLQSRRAIVHDVDGPGGIEGAETSTAEELPSPDLIDTPTPKPFKPSKENTFAKVPERIRLEHVDVDPFGPPTQHPKTVERPRTDSVHVKGTLRNPKTLKGEVGVEVKIYDSSSQILKKKTKTSLGGKWLAFLKAGEYTIEFARPDKPIFKNLVVLEGQIELEVLV